MTEGLTGGLYGGFDLIFARFLVNANYFRRLGGIDGTNLVRGLDALAADDQVVFAAELSAHFFDGGAHFAHVLFFGEIDKRLVFERTFVKTNLQAGWGFHGGHSRSFPDKG